MDSCNIRLVTVKCTLHV